MPSLTTWNRIEIETRQESLAESLAARVHDPLWMLARQWQLGEFRATDGGSAVGVGISRIMSMLDQLHSGIRDEWDANNYSPLEMFDPRQAPLEALVEQDGTAQGGNDVRLRARAGRYFLDLMAKAGLTG